MRLKNKELKKMQCNDTVFVTLIYKECLQINKKQNNSKEEWTKDEMIHRIKKLPVKHVNNLTKMNIKITCFKLLYWPKLNRCFKLVKSGKMDSFKQPS